MEIVVGTIKTVRVQKPDTYWGVIDLDTDKGVVTVAGVLPGLVVNGFAVRCSGEWSEHDEYGRQFKASSITLFERKDIDGLKAFLSGDAVKGVGPKTIDRVFEVYGDDALHKIKTNHLALSTLKGVSKKQALALHKAVIEHEARLEVTGFLHRHFGPGRAERLYEKYGTEAKALITENPYRLMGEVRGFGFKLADRMASQVGVATDSPERVKAGLGHGIEEAMRDGHCYARIDELMAATKALLGVSLSDVEAAFSSELKEGRLAPCPTNDDLVGLPKMALMERRAADRLGRLMRGRSKVPRIDVTRAVAWAGSRLGFELDREQRNGVKRALDQKVSIITGPPGSGKTSLLRAVVDILKAKRVHIRIACATGAAAARAAEATGHPSSTIHRLLGYKPGIGFEHHAGNPIDCDYLITDETSMTSLGLFVALLMALPDHCTLLIVGDADQLPSIQPGLVLLDLINSGAFQVTRLQTIHRNRGSVMEIGDCLRRGVMPPVGAFDDEFAEFVETKDSAETGQVIVDRGGNDLEWPRLNPLQDVQAIAPRFKGADGVDRINEGLKQKLNPNPATICTALNGLGVGDRVRETKNRPDMDIYNGDVGVVRSINAEALTVMLPRGPVTYPIETAKTLALAFCITGHRGQGAEFKGLIASVDKSSSIMLDRALLYTIWTRTKVRGVLVGQRWAMEKALQRNTSLERNTGLCALLRESLPTMGSA